jgi:hypothetical protein
LPGHDCGDVTGIEPDNRRSILEERRHEDGTLLTGRRGHHRLLVRDLDDEGILEHVHATAVLAIGRDRSALVRAVAVVDGRAPQGLELFAIIDPEMG